MTKICFVYPALTSFIKKDIGILQQYFDVDPIQPRAFLVPSFRKSPLGILRLFSKVMKDDIVFCWFADVNAFYSVLFSKLFRKKSIVVVGGVDAACEPSIGYGYFSKFLPRVIATMVYKFVDRILVVDPSLKKNLINYLPFKNEVDDKTFYIPTGYDSKKWSPDGKPKENVVLTVGTYNSLTLYRKGFDTFIKASKKMSDVLFVLVGKINPLDKKEIEYFWTNKNLKISGFVSDEKLLEYYRRAKVYCQLSLFEGLPNALCEAMLCGCVPVGTKRCGIPEAIGRDGFYVKYGDVDSTIEGIRKALESKHGSTSARYKILKQFPLEKRILLLRSIVESLMEKEQNK